MINEILRRLVVQHSIVPYHHIMCIHLYKVTSNYECSNEFSGSLQDRVGHLVLKVCVQWKYKVASNGKTKKSTNTFISGNIQKAKSET